jgi:hypothetical protein
VTEKAATRPIYRSCSLPVQAKPVAVHQPFD